MGARAQQAATAAGGDAAWKNDMAARRAELIKRNGPGTDAALREKLVAMYASDQEARGAGTGHPMYTAKTAEVDAQLTCGAEGDCGAAWVAGDCDGGNRCVE